MFSFKLEIHKRNKRLKGEQKRVFFFCMYNIYFSTIFFLYALYKIHFMKYPNILCVALVVPI
jgi:hypothetical protein